MREEIREGKGRDEKRGWEVEGGVESGGREVPLSTVPPLNKSFVFTLTTIIEI